MKVQLQVFLVFYCVCHAAFANYRYDYLSDPCVSDPNDRVLYPEPNGSYSGIIKLTSAGDYGANFNCSMKLVTAPGYKLYIRVNSIDIFINGTDCIDYLRVVYDGVIAWTSCGSANIIFEDVVNWAEVQFVSGSYNDPTDYKSGFDLHYNLVHSGNCTADEFRCKSQDTNNATKCVSSQLVCDKRINCPDDDDDEEEKMCEQMNTSSQPEPTTAAQTSTAAISKSSTTATATLIMFSITQRILYN